MRTPVRFRHATLFSYWENPSTLFRNQEKTLGDLFSFGKIQERNNQPIDIGRPNRFFQCIISRSNGIHRYRKKPYQIEIFSFDHILIVNTIYKDRYYKVRTSNLIETITHREENRFMDGIKYAVFTNKSIRLLGKNQYTSNVESGSTRT
ncbi:hypothetical protein H5410_027767 [Solanum commersonii]|uniref:Uncharacterized protein n=1 Tax=Solanum commersonii TaxID=4109 RepID=A0A9J5Z031_SOLCO|nr:hypothetical protein H5410_027767 [Solanum commersonii]